MEEYAEKQKEILDIKVNILKKAEKAMEMLYLGYHEAVTYDNVSVFRFPKDDEV